MRPRTVSFVLGLTALLGSTAHAIQTPPTTITCSGLVGTSTFSPNLFSLGTQNFRAKVQGTFLPCASNADFVIKGEISGYVFNPGPNTCTTAGGSNYTGKAHIKWYLLDSNGNTYTRTTVAALATLNGSGFTSTWTSSGSYPPAGTVITINGTVGPTIPGTGCSATTVGPGANIVIWSSPGSASF